MMILQNWTIRLLEWHEAGDWYGRKGVPQTEVPRSHIPTGPKYKYHVINLKRSPQRLEEFRHKCELAELHEVCRFDAVDCEDICDVGWYVQMGMMTHNVMPHWEALMQTKDKGDLAVMLSHMYLWQKIEHDSDDCIHIVFEDDANVPRNFQHTVQQMIQTVPRDWQYSSAVARSK